MISTGVGVVEVVFLIVSMCSLALYLSDAILDDRLSSVGLAELELELDGLTADMLSSEIAPGQPIVGKYDE